MAIADHTNSTVTFFSTESVDDGVGFYDHEAEIATCTARWCCGDADYEAGSCANGMREEDEVVELYLPPDCFKFDGDRTDYKFKLVDDCMGSVGIFRTTYIKPLSGTTLHGWKVVGVKLHREG